MGDISELKRDYKRLSRELDLCEDSFKSKANIVDLFVVGFLSIIASASIGILEKLKEKT